MGIVIGLGVAFLLVQVGMYVLISTQELDDVPW